jgi:hypothetical protein
MPELEIINGPLSLYWAPVGESFPAAADAPAGNWALIGTSGAHNYSEDGVTVGMEKSVEFFRALASGFPRKAFITEADITVTVTMADMTLAQMRLALNQNVVTSATPIEHIQLDIGVDVQEIALLVRGTGKSPQFSGGNLQYELPRVVEDGSRELSHVKGEPAMAELAFRLIYDEGETNPAGRLVVAIA